MNDLRDAVALMASYIRCGKAWDAEVEVAYKKALIMLQHGKLRLDYVAVDPSTPCVWPNGTCSFMKKKS